MAAMLRRRVRQVNVKKGALKPFPFESEEKSWERFGKDNCRIRYVGVRSGAAKYQANQLRIDLVLVSGTRGRRFKSSQARHCRPLPPYDIDQILRIAREEPMDVLLDHRKRAIGILFVEAAEVRLQ